MLNKESFAVLHAQKHGLNKKDAEMQVNQLLDTLADAVENHGGAKLNPLMFVEVVETKACIRRNPQNGSEVHVPAGHKIKIKQLKGLKGLANK